MAAVYTNVLVYAADVDPRFHQPCREWLERQRSRPEVYDWPILYEFLRVTTHPRVMRRPWRALTAWGVVEALLGSPGLGVLSSAQRHPDVAEGS